MPTQPANPILYSFRRCPYAMRARMAIKYSGQQVELREVVLKDKPTELLTISPKGTVPVLVITDGAGSQQVIDESLDIMTRALEQHDPDHWLTNDHALRKAQLDLIAENDGDFKASLDRYKYADRYPEHPQEYYRNQGETFLQVLEDKLSQHPYLFGTTMHFADIAIFPFIRQFAHVDKNWFDQTDYKHLQAWLNKHLESELFLGIMKKYPKWHADAPPVSF